MDKSCRTSHIGLFSERPVCGYMICMFNSWVDSTTRFGFLKIKGLHLGLSEGSCHGKRERMIQIGDVFIFSAVTCLAQRLNTTLYKRPAMARRAMGLRDQRIWTTAYPRTAPTVPGKYKACSGRGFWQSSITKLLVQLPFLILNQPTALSRSL